MAMHDPLVLASSRKEFQLCQKYIHHNQHPDLWQSITVDHWRELSVNYSSGNFFSNKKLKDT
jgi:hypothetical protein